MGTINRIPILDVKIYLTNSWWRDLLEYCAKFQIQLIDPLPQLLPRTTNDITLRGQELHRLNICCMFLYITFLSDMITLDGKNMERWAWEGQHQLFNSSHTQEVYPKQPEELNIRYWN